MDYMSPLDLMLRWMSYPPMEWIVREWRYREHIQVLEQMQFLLPLTSVVTASCVLAIDKELLIFFRRSMRLSRLSEVH